MDLSPDALAYLEDLDRYEWVRPLVERWAPTAPEPADPQQCRWCRGRVIVLANGQRHCQERSCVAEPLATRQCLACQRHFRTGNLHGDVCWECETREDRAIAESVGPVSPHGPANISDGSRPRRA